MLPFKFMRKICNLTNKNCPNLFTKIIKSKMHFSLKNIIFSQLLGKHLKAIFMGDSLESVFVCVCIES